MYVTGYDNIYGQKTVLSLYKELLTLTLLPECDTPSRRMQL
jgi:hypothetical protein